MARRIVGLVAPVSTAFLLGALVAQARAEAMDLSGGVNMGGVLIGTRPRFAVSPHAAISWRPADSFLLAIQDAVSVLPATDVHGVGVYNHTSIAIGYARRDGSLSIGPSVAIYSVPACGRSLCARLKGASPGAMARVDYYFSGSFGVSASATVDWLAGSVVLPAGVAATVLVGPLLTWSSR